MEGGGGNQNDWEHAVVLVTISRVGLLEMSSSGEQVQEGATSRCINN